MTFIKASSMSASSDRVGCSSRTWTLKESRSGWISAWQKGQLLGAAVFWRAVLSMARLWWFGYIRCARTQLQERLRNLTFGVFDSSIVMESLSFIEAEG